MLMKATKSCKQKCYFLTFFCHGDDPVLSTLTDSTSFVLLFCLLLHRVAVRISLPFHIFLQVFKLY